jgi:hypothetical protein
MLLFAVRALVVAACLLVLPQASRAQTDAPVARPVVMPGDSWTYRVDY